MFLKKLKKFAKNKLIFIIISLVLNQKILAEGFLAGTLVKTHDDKYVPIEQLKENDLVVSYNFKDKILTNGKIVQSKKTIIKVV